MSLVTRLIHRPVAITLLALAILLAGLISFRLLPVAPLPEVDYPVIIVHASLPGASPETMASSVATPLERSLARIAGISEMTSTSSLGTTSIVLVFDYDRDINGAARDVQAAINAAQASLPSGMPARPGWYKINPSDAPVMILALTSDLLSPGELYAHASTGLKQKLSQIEGVGEVAVSGSSLPAIRVSLDPLALFNRGVSLDAVRSSIVAASQKKPQGATEDRQQRWQIRTNEVITTAADYQPLVIHYTADAAVRLQDVATVTDSVEDVRHAGLFKGRPAILLIIRKTAAANIISTVERIRTELPALRKNLPAAIQIDIAQDRSPAIRASLKEAGRSLFIAVCLVILVVFFFLRSARATLIPAVAVPVSLIGSFAAMYLCGFSLNNLSVMALIIATGFVVDDAIVVLENIARHAEAGMKPLQAAIHGTREVSFTVLAMSLSLVTVYLPMQAGGGMIGRLFQEFSVTLSVAILISLAVSLTLTPVMCVRLLKGRQPSLPQQNRLLLQIQQHYHRSLNRILDHHRWTVLILPAVIGLTSFLFIQMPKTFLPEQDNGRLLGYVLADQQISFSLMQQKFQHIMQIVQQEPAVASVSGFIGGMQKNSGVMFISLKPLNEREENARQVIARLRPKLGHVAGAQLYLQNVQDIRVGGRESNAQYHFSLRSDNLADLRRWQPELVRAFSALPQLIDVSSDQHDKATEMAIIYDRPTMSRLGISVAAANTLLNNAFGQRQISTLYQPRDQVNVIMEVDARYTQDSSALTHMFVINSSGQPIPLSAFARWQPVTAPISVNHDAMTAASGLSFDLAEGVTLPEASVAIGRVMTQLGVPASIRGDFSGSAQAFQQAQSHLLLVVFAAIVTVYLVLGVLYESYVHPLTILSTLPSAGLGALLGLTLSATPFSLIALLGILLLTGMVMKNAIMIVSFAVQAQRYNGLSAREAILLACNLRFRPIVMTTLAALLGALPLVAGSGEGAELRQPLGITMASGLIISQWLTLYTTPVIYLLMDKLCMRKSRPGYG